jgi:hypothetical protein
LSIWILALFFAAAATAHEVRPALLQITQQGEHQFSVLWKQPVNGEVALHLVPRLSGGALDREPDVATVTPSFALKLWRNVSDERQSLSGQQLAVVGLDRSITDVLVSVTLRDGRNIQQLLKPGHS